MDFEDWILLIFMVVCIFCIGILLGVYFFSDLVEDDVDIDDYLYYNDGVITEKFRMGLNDIYYYFVLDFKYECMVERNEFYSFSVGMNYYIG